jgi:hypothetical protein
MYFRAALLAAFLLSMVLPGLALADCAVSPEAAKTIVQSFTVQPQFAKTPTWLIPSDQPVTLALTSSTPFAAGQTFTVTGSLGGDAMKSYSVQLWQPATDLKSGTLTIDAVTDNGNIVPRTLDLVVAACSGTPPPIGKASPTISFRLPAGIIALAITVVFYVLGALAIPKDHRCRLSPLWLALDGTGRASLSQMQIIFFSVIVLYLVSYILLRTAILASLSDNVLLLLGIAGAGSAMGQAATTNLQRLSFDNWTWIKCKGWTAGNGFHVSEPRWRDLLTTNGEFDPYRFQMVSFSFVVGISLLFLGLDGLASFTIPPSLLAVIGLSQVGYVGGKIVAPGNMGDLDKKLTDLRKAQDDFLAATADKWVPPTAPGTSERKAQLTAAGADNRAKYVAFRQLVCPAYTMFGELFEVKNNRAAANLEPDPTC